MVGVDTARSSPAAAVRRTAVFLGFVLSAGSVASAPLFRPAVVLPAYSGGSPIAPVTPIAGVSGSFNSAVDGDDDVAVVNRDDNRLLIYESDGNGNLHLARAYGSFGFDVPRSIATGDVNGDGKLDLVVGDRAGISVLLGDGAGAFAAATPQRPAGLKGSWSVGTTQVFLADVNRDGRLDIVAAKDDPGDAREFGEWHLVVLLGRGGGTFDPAIDYDLDAPFALGGITIFAFGDFDGDALPDVMYQDGGHVRFLKGRADGTFAAPAVARDLTGSTFVSGRAVAAADVDGDGKLDFVATNGLHKTFWCKGNGNGTLQAPILIVDVSAKVTDKAYHLLVTDLDANGQPDIVVSGKAFLQRKDHTFALAQNVGTSADTEPLAAGHFNRDQRADLVMQGPDPLSISVLPSNGHDPPDHVLIVSGAFQSTLINTVFPEMLRLRVLDADGIGVKRVPVTFAPSLSGASAEVDPVSTTTDSKGYAITAAIANAFVGCYDVNAIVQGLADPFPFNLCNTAQDHFVVVAGTPQTAVIHTPFATPLKVQVVDGSNGGRDGVTVTFSAPAGDGAPTAILTPTSVVTSGGGFAQVTAAANDVAGSYDVNVSADGILPPETPSSFVLTNSVPPPEPALIVLSPRTSPQTTVIDAPFDHPLRVQVVDTGSVGVAGIRVDYAVEPDAFTGASANLSAAFATTDGSGFAQITATANGLVGSYGVKVTLEGNASVSPGLVQLRNTPPPAHEVAPVSGTSQAAAVTEPFPETLSVRLTDALGNPTPGVAVYFVAPASGPSAVLSAASVPSDANGFAEVTATANAEAGSYSVSAVVFHTTVEEPIASPFVLTNTGTPTIAKSFGVTNLAVNATTTLTFALTNPNAGVALTGVGFTDALPAGLVVATPNAPASTCGGTVTAAAGGGSVTLSDGGLASDSSCTIALDVTAVNVGVKNNTTSAVTSAEGGPGGTASATLTVTAGVVPPTIAKAFVPAGIPLNGTSTLTFTLTNPNPDAALTGVGFTDTLPGGLTVTDGASARCGGTLTASDGDTIALTGATLAPGGTCAFSVTVTAPGGGVKGNVTSAVTSTEGGTGGTATAFLVVVAPPAVAPPTIAKKFGASSIVVNESTSLTFTLTNPNAGSALSGVGFTDTLPPGLAAANGTGAACGGTTTASGDNTIALAGARIAAGGTCTFSVTVTGTTAGVKNNTTSAVISAEGGAGGNASASLRVEAGVAPPTIAKAFGRPIVTLNEGTSLTFTLTNPNPGTALTGVGFTDGLPDGLVVATPSGLASTCGGAAVAVAGGSSVALADGALPSGGSCTIRLDVTGLTVGAKHNTTRPVTSTEGGTGATASARVIVLPSSPPVPTLSAWALALLALLLGVAGAHLFSRLR